METLSGLIDRFWQFASGLSDQFQDSDFSLISHLKEKFFALVLQGLAEGWSFIFGELTSFLYRILFSNYSGTVSTGKFAVDQIFSFQTGDVFSVDMIYFFFGLILTIFTFKLAFDFFLKFMSFLR